jgi:hypothetical protein
MSEHEDEEAPPADFNTLMQRFVEVLGRFADPAQTQRDELEKELVDAWDTMTESIINGVLEMSPAELARAYPLLVQYLAHVEALRPRSEPGPAPS